MDRPQRPAGGLSAAGRRARDTKFIEQHRNVLAELLDRQLDPGRVDRDHPPSRFAQRYGFRDKPTYVRLRTLDDVPPASAPFREIAVRVGELAVTPVDAARVIVVENEVSYLALPPVKGAVTLLGGGYALARLAPLRWLHDRELIYWGISTHTASPSWTGSGSISRTPGRS